MTSLRRTLFDHDAGAFLCALVLHLTVAVALWKMPPYFQSRRRIVEFDVKKPPAAAPLTQRLPEPDKAPPPPQHMVKARRVRQPTPPTAPIPNQTPPREPPKEPVKPIFGVTMSSTTEGESSFSVAVGNSTIADPKSTAPRSQVRPLAAAPPASAPGPVFHAASPLEIRDWPDVIGDSCVPPERLYPRDLLQQGVDGKTVLRVEIDEQGKVHGVRVVSGTIKAFNDLAVSWMKTHCRFSPAKNTLNKGVSAVIPYTFVFVLDH